MALADTIEVPEGFVADAMPDGFVPDEVPEGFVADSDGNEARLEQLRQQVATAKKDYDREMSRANMFAVGETLARAVDVPGAARRVFNYISGFPAAAVNTAFGDEGQFKKAATGQPVEGALRTDTILGGKPIQGVSVDEYKARGYSQGQAETVSGLSEGLAGLVNFFRTPEGVLMAGSANLTGPARAIAAGSITGEMAAHSRDIADSFAESSKTGDKKQMAKSAFDFLATTAGMVGMAKVGGGEELAPIPKIPEQSLRNHGATIEAMRLREEGVKPAEAMLPAEVKPLVQEAPKSAGLPIPEPITKPLPEPARPVKPAPQPDRSPVVTSMEHTAEQLKLASDNIDQLLTRGNWTDDIDVQLAKGRPADPKTRINVEIDEHIKSQLVAAAKNVDALKRQVRLGADPVTNHMLDVEVGKMKVWLARFQESGRTWHDVGMSRQRMAKELAESSESLREFLTEVRPRLPILNQIYRDFKEGNYQQGARNIVDGLRVNRFTAGSWTLDLLTNTTALATRLPAWATMDLAHLAKGRPAYRMATALRALKLNAQNMKPGERFRLPEYIERELGTVAGGEFGGLPRQVMIGFDTIYPDNPALVKQLNHLDYIAGGPVRMKRAMDNFYGRFGATAELYNSAYVQGRTQGLKGDSLKEFVDGYVKNPPKEAMEKAIETGHEFKFNRNLGDFQEKFSNNMGVKLFVDAYPRWSFQFMRWAAEMIGADRHFVRRVAKGEATAEQTASYLSKAATGWGAIYAFNELLYNQVDSNTMEYVDEQGDRTRLSGRTPAPELYFVSAVLRGDWSNAQAALPHLSLPLAKVLGGEPGGVLADVIATLKESSRGRYTAEQTAKELESLANDLIPGRSMLGLIRSLYDPTLREGFGSPVPGIAEFLPQKINPTTGEPSSPRQRIPGTGITFPAVGGTPFPGSVRVLNDIEKTLLNHEFTLSRPRRTSMVELPPEDVPKNIRREYEIRVGKNIERIVGEGIKNPDFKQVPYETRKEVLKTWVAAARANARAEINAMHEASGRIVPSPSIRKERMPKHLTQ